MRGFFAMSDIRETKLACHEISSSLLFSQEPVPLGLREINLCISDETYNGVYQVSGGGRAEEAGGCDGIGGGDEQVRD